MPLQDQIVPIVLSGGVDTKTDDKSVALDKLLVLENGVFETPRKIRKRYANTSLGDAIVGGGNITLSTGVSANQNTNQLVQFADNKTYAYSEAKSGFIGAGSTYPVTAKNSSVVDGYNLQGSESCDMAVIGDYEIYSYAVSPSFNENGIQFLIRDRDTKATLYQSAFLASPANTATRVTKVLAWNGFAYQFKTGGNVGVGKNITISKIDPTLTAPVVTTATIARAGSPTPQSSFFDAMVTPLGLAVVYYTTFNNIQIALYDASLTLLNTANVDVTAFGGTVRNGLSLAFDAGTSNTFIFWSSADAYYTVLSSAYAVVLALTKINAASPFGGGTQKFYISASLSTGADQVTVLFTSVSDTPTTHGSFPLTSKFNVSSTAVTLTDYNFCNTGAIEAKIAAYGGKYYVVLGYGDSSSSGQNSYYLNEVTLGGSSDVNTLGNAARFLIGTAASSGITFPSPRPELFLNGSNLIVALRVLSSLSTKLGTPVNAVSKEEFSFLDSAHTSISTVPDTNFFVSGGEPIMIDTTATEQLFNVFPEPPLATILPPIDPSLGLSVGTYQYFAIYEWIDAKGQVHQSSPSLPVTVINTVATSIVELSYYSLLNTMKQNVAIVFYRTLANGVTPYRLAPDAAQTIINQRVRSDGSSIQLFDDIATDTGVFGISSNQILYTTGGILPNDPAPSCSFQWLYKNRVMLGGLDDGNTIWFSKTRVEGEPVKFSGFFLTNVDIAGGDVLSGGTLDDKCVFFKRNKIFYMYGDGPNDAGGGGQFSIPQEVSSPVGCAYPKSVVSTPLGLMFKSEKGIYLLDRGLNVQWIGAPVAAFNQFNVTSTIHMATVNQVRFFLDNGIVLMFDYAVSQWSTFTNISAVGSTLFQNQATYVGSDGVIYQETPGSYLDNGVTPITLTIGTPWIKLSSLQNFERCKQVYLLGDYKSAHTLTIQAAFDYESTYTESFTWSPVAGDSPDQVRIFLQKQKCESLKLQISDNATSTSGEGYTLSEISILAGMKKGLFKVPATKSVG